MKLNLLTRGMFVHSTAIYFPLDYIFNKTADKNDDESTTKYDQIVGDLKSLLNKYPGYKVYLTGHSLVSSNCMKTTLSLTSTTNF